MSLRHALLVLPVLAAATLCLAAPAFVTVVQKGRAFSVMQLAIAAGDTIRFSNQDVFDHQVYVASPEMSFESDEHEPGTVLDLPFPKRGEFTVLCHMHPKMHLAVSVR